MSHAGEGVRQCEADRARAGGREVHRPVGFDRRPRVLLPLHVPSAGWVENVTPRVGGRNTSDNYLPRVVAGSPRGEVWDQTVTAACEWAAPPNPGRATSGAPRRHNPAAHRMGHLPESPLRLDGLPPPPDQSARCHGSAGNSPSQIPAEPPRCRVYPFPRRNGSAPPG
jgi:hypothetical protein